MKLKNVLLLILTLVIWSGTYCIANDDLKVSYDGMDLTIPAPEGFMSVSDDVWKKIDPKNYKAKFSKRKTYHFYSIDDVNACMRGEPIEVISQVIVIPHKNYEGKDMDVAQFAQVKQTSKDLIKKEYTANSIKRELKMKDIDYDRDFIVDSYKPYFESDTLLFYAFYSQYALKNDKNRYVMCDVCSNVLAGKISFLVVYRSSIDDLDEVKNRCEKYIHRLSSANTKTATDSAITENHADKLEKFKQLVQDSLNKKQLKESKNQKDKVAKWERQTIANAIFDWDEELKEHQVYSGNTMHGIEFDFFAPKNYEAFFDKGNNVTFIYRNSKMTGVEFLSFRVMSEDLPPDLKAKLMEKGLAESIQNYYMNVDICDTLFNGRGVVDNVIPLKIGDYYAVKFEFKCKDYVNGEEAIYRGKYLLLIIDERILIVSINHANETKNKNSEYTDKRHDQAFWLLSNIAATINIVKK